MARSSRKEKAAIFLMRACLSRVKLCAVGMCNAILGNDLKVPRIIGHERKRLIDSVVPWLVPLI